MAVTSVRRVVVVAALVLAVAACEEDSAVEPSGTAVTTTQDEESFAPPSTEDTDDPVGPTVEPLGKVVPIAGPTLDGANTVAPPEFFLSAGQDSTQACASYRNRRAGVPVTVDSVAFSDDGGGAFALGEPDACGDPCAGATLAPGDFCGVAQVFQASEPGRYQATLVFSLRAACADRVSPPCDQVPESEQPTEAEPVTVTWEATDVLGGVRGGAGPTTTEPTPENPDTGGAGEPGDVTTETGG